jgi:hypothetical protein
MFKILDFCFFALLLLGFCGWIMNIINLIQDEMSTGFMLARAIGIFIAPLGAILGFI